LIVFALIVFPGVPGVRVIAAVVSVAPAVASYRLLENPIRWRTLNSRLLRRLLIFSLVPAVSVTCVLYLGAQVRWGRVWSSAVIQGQTAASIRGCHESRFDPNLCRWKVHDPRATVFLVGDSQASALSDGLITTDAALHLDTVESSQNACPFITPNLITWNPRYAAEKGYCHSWQSLTFKYAMSKAVQIVVIANRSPLYVNPDFGYALLRGQDGTFAQTRQSAAIAWRDALNQYVSKLRNAGKRVILVAEPPEGSTLDATVQTSLLIAHPRLPERAARAAANQVRAASFAAEVAVAAANPGVIVVDPFVTLCEAVTCPGGRSGDSFYSDATHLSHFGSLQMQEPLSRALRQALAH